MFYHLDHNNKTLSSLVTHTNKDCCVCLTLMSLIGTSLHAFPLLFYFTCVILACQLLWSRYNVATNRADHVNKEQYIFNVLLQRKANHYF